jgi:hypothetical protein
MNIDVMYNNLMRDGCVMLKTYSLSGKPHYHDKRRWESATHLVEQSLGKICFFQHRKTNNGPVIGYACILFPLTARELIQQPSKDLKVF